jgi:uncharacterized RDD family membrane protein YckC
MDEQQTPAQPPAMEPPPAMSPPPASSWEAAPAAAPMPVPGAAGFVYADVPNRVIALILDGILLGLVSIVLSIILATIGLRTGGITFTGGEINVTFNPVATLIYGVLGTIINGAYFIWSWTTQRATLGMRVLGMQVGNAFDGKTLTTDQALRRAVALWGPSTIAQFFNGLPAIGSLLGLLAFLWVLYLLYTTAKSPTKQGFHDTFANTVVVKAGRMV